MNWRIKGLAQRTLSCVPGGTWINDRMQRTVGGLRRFDAAVKMKVSDWTILADHMRELGFAPQGRHYVEIGTGWFPVLPLCYALVGSTVCHTYDLLRHLDEQLSLRLLGALTPHLPAIATAGQRSLPEVQEACAALKQSRSLSEILERAHIQYHAPADATATGLPDQSVDVVFSNSVFEHVPADTIRSLMRESYRILRRGGLVIHSLNCADHYAYFDRNITFINYLAYSEDQWRFWNNRLQYQNRLRPQDFIEMAEDAGLKIVLRKQITRPDLLQKLPHLRIAGEFKDYSAEELCSTSLDFVAQKP